MRPLLAMRRILAIAVLLLLLVVPGAADAQAPNYQPSASAGLLETAEGSGAYETEQSSFVAVTSLLINTALAVLGGAFVLLLIYAGVLYLGSQGDAERVGKAKRILTSSIVGILIVVLAYAGVTFIFNVLFFSQLSQEDYERLRDQQVEEICRSPEACASDPLCFGTEQCAFLQGSSSTEVTDPCRVDPQSVECDQAQFSELTELCNQDPFNPLCDSLPSRVIPIP